VAEDISYCPFMDYHGAVLVCLSPWNMWSDASDEFMTEYNNT
jgi:hypothetical protein